ncbi:hypothetical protein SISSUDRAFT_1067457 [Sistotremastrum suecicum HHB10207 ss-3]|uniref:Uncharacterized protein n=1 Tax=Sistotremastrum suecicum HHB10207 ss-3 TaxID=1314776 RepID=A0A165X3V0_9AGAM|nr:hypothetical protein SISSUDRAFT_1067457 [Sistotremastrum suecicum HHB10207 ss-3]
MTLMAAAAVGSSTAPSSHWHLQHIDFPNLSKSLQIGRRVNGKVCGLLGPWDRIHAHIGYESESD